MTTVAVLSQKGGVGKTTLAVNLASELARDGSDVLVVDPDPQGAASRWPAISHPPTLSLSGSTARRARLDVPVDLLRRRFRRQSRQ